MSSRVFLGIPRPCSNLQTRVNFEPLVVIHPMNLPIDRSIQRSMRASIDHISAIRDLERGNEKRAGIIRNPEMSWIEGVRDCSGAVEGRNPKKFLTRPRPFVLLPSLPPTEGALCGVLVGAGLRCCTVAVIGMSRIEGDPVRRFAAMLAGKGFECVLG